MEQIKMAPIKNITNTKHIVLTGLLFAIAVILSIVEDSLPPVPIAVPGVKFGLSNIAVMFTLFYLGKNTAFSIALLKAFFVLITRGLMAGILSLFGGILSIIIMILLMLLFKDKISYLVISIFGAIFHNLGQFIVITLMYKDLYLWSYLPVLLISGLIAGIMTSTLLRFVMPILRKLV